MAISNVSLQNKLYVVPTRGLEPPHLAAYAPQAYVYTNFTTSAESNSFKERSYYINLSGHWGTWTPDSFDVNEVLYQLS